MKMILLVLLGILISLSAGFTTIEGNDNIPLKEHPRPDFQREQWLNLNGSWQFKFDVNDAGENEKWFDGKVKFDKNIMVPFSWGSKLSGVDDEGDIGWYKRELNIPGEWSEKNVFLIIGACDWHTKAWIDGNFLGEHKGGYTPFEFDLTKFVKAGSTHNLILRVDDTPHPFKLYGKQGYGRAAGIWQTTYLEARPDIAFDYVHFTPDIDNNKVQITAGLNIPADRELFISLNFNSGEYEKWKVEKSIAAGEKEIKFFVDIENPRLWSLDDPYLYYVDVLLKAEGNSEDKVSTYFGMRKISVVNLPGTDYPYVALNDEPVYLQMSLDQSYHPDGYYTFPTDDFMRDEILRSRRIGLNGQRIHIKVEVPRKLYWADRLGILIMADIPNFWGEPTSEARAETEYCLREMIKRDYNHPSIFSWVNFNETWGLRTKGEGYNKETQEWVKSIYYLTKELDPTRLVEDNSTNNLDHVVTDLNTWHSYIPGHNWDGLLDLYSKETYPGSPFNFVDGYTQSGQPMLNSECGNVWGYEKDDVGFTTGDVDWSWDYHQMINAFRRHPKCAGWLYTEHHDVINEWNGYWRYDRSEKYTGLGDISPGMTLNDFHSPFYIVLGERLSLEVNPGEKVDVPIFASFFSNDDVGKKLNLEFELFGWDEFGNRELYSTTDMTITNEPYLNKEISPVQIKMPGKKCVAVLGVTLKTTGGSVLNKNFTTFIVSGGESENNAQKIIRFNPASFSDSDWSLKQWNVLDDLKVNGAGHGYFEYSVPWPEDLVLEDIDEAALILELSAKRLNGKDVEGSSMDNDNFMLGGGTHDPSASPNSYPMTDSYKFPSAVKIIISDEVQSIVDLEDDPADHRGILSWHNQIRDYTVPENPTSFRDFKGGFLHEAGSYGYLVNVSISRSALEKASREGELKIRLEVDDSLPGGVAIYGEKFGRYPFDPTIFFKLNTN